MAACKAPAWAEITAVFGGTFDPPHRGHLEAAKGLFEAPGVQRVLVLPTSSPPHKPCFTVAEHRIEMLRRCFAPILRSNVEIDLTEINRSSRYPDQFNYSYDTLQELGQRLHGAGRSAFVIGADQLTQIASWYRFPEVLDLCHWIVLARKPGGLEIALEGMQKLSSSGLATKCPGDAAGANGTWQVGRKTSFLKIVTTRAPDLSSTQIREVLNRSGTAPEGSLVPEVEAYLKLHHLYGT